MCCTVNGFYCLLFKAKDMSILKLLSIQYILGLIHFHSRRKVYDNQILESQLLTPKFYDIVCTLVIIITV